MKTYGAGTGAGAVPVLDGVSLSVDAGRFVAVMGPSGSGKSTLLHLLGALDRPGAGEVYLDGQRVSDLDDDALTILRRRHVGFVFQLASLVPVLTVRENVSLPLVIAGEPDEARTAELLAAVGLADVADNLPAQLSGGQQQRVAMARALVTRPTVVLADEPTGNLDRRTGGEILRLLRGLHDDRALTVVMVTHDAEAAAVADEVVFLRDGTLAGALRLADEASYRHRVERVLGWLGGLEAEAVDPLAGSPPATPRADRVARTAP